MNMFKKNGGFTLVELIVVIAILAILAGIAIPAYSGYIKKANDAAVVTKLDAIATAAQAADATTDDITEVKVTDDTTVVITVATTNDSNTDGVDEQKEVLKKIEADFKMFYTGSSVTSAGSGTITVPSLGIKDTSYANGATWTEATGWKAVK